MELNKEELVYLLNAVDANVRANGLQGAANGLVVANKLQAQAKRLADADLPTDGGEPAAED